MDKYSFSVATLDDWLEVKQFWLDFKEGKYGKRIDATLGELYHYMVYSNTPSTTPAKCGILLGRMDGNLVGVFVLQEIYQPVPDGNGAYCANCFIAGVHIHPKVPLEFAKKFLDYAEMWGKVRNHRQIVGNVRKSYKFRAVLERFGFEHWHCVIGKDLKYGQE